MPLKIPRPPLPVLLAGILAVAAGAIVLLLFLLPDHEQAADLLPLRETAALFHGLTEGDRSRLASRFPPLSGLTVPRGASADVAVLRLPGGGFGWALFLEGEQARSLSTASLLSTRRFQIIPSSREVETLLTHPAEPLARSPAFRALSSRATSPAWVFLADARLLAPTPTEADDVLLSNLQDPSILIGWESSAVTLAFLFSRGSSPSTNASPPPLTPAPSFALSLQNPQRILDGSSPLLPQTTRAIVTGLITRQAQDMLGEDLSMRYDLLPLLGQDATLSLAETASGSLRFLMTGHPETGNLRESLAALRRRMRSLLPAQRVLRRTLERGFTSVTIEDDPSLLTERDEERGGWALHSIVRRDTGMGFFDAVRGDQLILTNDAAWLAQALAPPAAAQRNPGGSFVLAADASPLRAFLRDTLQWNLADTLMETFGPGKGKILVSVATEGTMAMIRLENDP